MPQTNTLVRPLRRAVGWVLRRQRFARQRRALRALVRSDRKRVVVGSGGTAFAGWVSTEQGVLDLLDPLSWERCLQRQSLDAILAEHVWEHLHYPEQAVTAATTCFSFLRPGGRLRVAVPDGLHPNPEYIQCVKPGGCGAGADDHKVLYTYATLVKIFRDAGFEVRLLEYFDEAGNFHANDWDPADGFIERSKRFDTRNVDGRLTYTSIVLDAIRPSTSPP